MRVRRAESAGIWVWMNLLLPEELAPTSLPGAFVQDPFPPLTLVRSAWPRPFGPLSQHSQFQTSF